MKIILTTAQGGKERQFSTSPFHLLLTLVLLGGFLLLAGGWLGYLSGADEAAGQGMNNYQDLSELLRLQQVELEELKAEDRRQRDALVDRLGLVQARLLGLEGLAGQLADQAGVKGEIALTDVTSGGVWHSAEKVLQAQELVREIVRLEERLEDRAWKLDLIEALLVDRRLQVEMLPAGKPIRRGLLTSAFGKRPDPFNGNEDFHRGVDFQAKPGTQIHAVASGLVAFSGERGGYGNIVEVRHRNGLMTRYAHNQRNLVKEGEAVVKGQVIALLGSSGRSSGPHVHFEVVKDGTAINPVKYLGNPP